MSNTLYAGYVLPAVFDAMRASGMLGNDALHELLRSWCVASVDGVKGGSKRPLDDGVLMTAANLVSRGLPTLPSVETEQQFAKTFGRMSVEADETGRICSTAEGIDPSFAERILDALKAVHPAIDSKEMPEPVKKSKAAGLAKMLASPLTDLFGPAITQLFDVDEDGKVLLLPFPFPHSGMYGIRAFAVRTIDENTPEGLDERGWYQLPVAAGNTVALKKHLKSIRMLVPSDAIPLVVQSRQIFMDEGADATQLALAPIAVARLQRILIELMLFELLDLSATDWNIAVVERDIPGAAVAVRDLQRLFEALFLLEGANRKLPNIKLTVYLQGDLQDSALAGDDQVTLVRSADAIDQADCVIDHSMLLRTGQGADRLVTSAPVYINARTARRDSGMRRLYLREPISWKGLQTQNGSKGEGDAAQQAAEHILQRCFRFTGFRPAQGQLLTQALQQKNWLASMPAGAGKSLMYQFAGLLQPSLSFVLEPLASLAMDQQDSLNDRWIDAVCCLHESLGRDARQGVRNRFVRGEALFCITTAELFRNEETVGMLQETVNAGLYYSQCVIDEAHALSEWSHDHRFNILGAMRYATRRLRAGKKNRLPLRLLTASVSHDALQDMRRQFAAAGDGFDLRDDQVVRHPQALPEGFHYYMLPSPVTGQGDEAVAAVRSKTLEKLLERLPSLFDELQSAASPSLQLPHFNPSTFYSAGQDNSGVVFCPFHTGPLGVSNRFSNAADATGVADTLKLKGIRPASFVGKDEGVTRVGRQALTTSTEERLRFKMDEANLLVATRAFGIGSHNRSIRYTAHLTMPPGLERFVQESGRAGHDGRLAVAALMYTPPDQNRSPDMQRAIEIFEAACSTPEREKQLIYDLLREISYPEDSNTGRIANLLTDEYGVELRVSYWQRGLDERMYLQEAGSSFGYIDLVTQKIVPDSRHSDQEYARELLEFAYDHSLEAAGSGPSLSSWVSATYPSDIDDGLARQLSDFETGAEFTLRIGFENDREPILTKIHNILWHDAEVEIQRKIVSEIPTESWKEFCTLLEQRSGKIGALSAMDPEVEARIVQLFNKLRSRIDTERIIHRLSLLGLVQDYSINPAARKFSLTVRVHSEEDYRGMLERYMMTFMPTTHVQRLLEPLSSYPGDSELERCLLFLVDFAYQNPLRHKRESVATMDAASRYGLKHGPAAFREYIEYSLTAKYARDDAIPQSLHSNDRFAVLAQYLDVLEDDGTASILANAAHLRDSAAFLSARLQSEPVVRALETFGRLILAGDTKSREKLSDAFIQHVLDCAAAGGLKGEDYQAAVAPLMQRFRRYLSAEDTSRLRAGLEDGEKRIAERAAAPIETVSVSRERRSADSTPDINAEETARTGTADKPVAAKKPAVSAASPKAAAARKIEQKPTERKPEERRQTEQRPSPPMAPVLEDAVDAEKQNAEIDALLADIENTIRREGPSEIQEAVEPAPRKKIAAKARQQKPAGTDVSKKDAEIDEAAKLAATMLLEEEKERKEAERREDQRRKAEQEAARREKAVAAKRAAEEKKRAEEARRRVDPLVAQQLQWLKTFNTRFLKDYESRNERISAGS